MDGLSDRIVFLFHSLAAVPSFLAVGGLVLIPPAPRPGNRTGPDGEVDLTVVIHCDNADDGLGRAVARENHDPGDDPVGLPCVSQGRPAESVVVLGVQISDQIDVVGHGHLLASVMSHDTGSPSRGARNETALRRRRRGGRKSRR